MTSKPEFLNDGSPDPYAIERHFADVAPATSSGRPSAADIRAREAADGMWRKVEEDLAKIDRADMGEMADD
jgi:hypothetical protein